METEQRIAALIVKQLKGELDASETDELNAWINDSDANRVLFQQLTDPDLLQPEVSAFYQSRKKILEKIQEAFPTPRVIPLLKKLSAAAAILLFLLAGGYLIFKNETQKQIAKTETQKNNIDLAAPSLNKAMITLASGRRIVLDSALNGTLAKEGNVKVVKLADGEVAYNGTGSEIEYNTLTNPRGSNVINITLADGTKIWLNSESSLKFPVAFIGNDRRVEITGEAYFEVTHDATKKFLVDANGVTTEVLGTHFNVNSYSDEEAIKITLLEGSVKVNKGSTSKVITPGQQAILIQARHDNGEFKVVNADIEEVLAWKNGRFNFLNGTNITAIMRQVSRWYDVDVEYKGDASTLIFSGKMSRKENASKLLEILKATGTVDFKIEDKRIIVISK